MITWFLKSLDFSFYRRQDSTLTTQTVLLPLSIGWWWVLLTSAAQAQEVEPAAERAITSSQTASAKVFRGFLYGGWEGEETGQETTGYMTAASFILCLTVLVQQQQVP